MRRMVTCARCGQDKEHSARGLCHACCRYLRYHCPDELADYPATKDHSMVVDDVQVERAAQWLVAFHRTVPRADRYNREHLDARPRLSRGEKIEVLRRTRHDVPPWIAINALGISGGRARWYLESAGVAA